MKEKYIDREWKLLLRSEQKFLDRNIGAAENGFEAKVKRFVPEKLEETLNTAFFKAFELIFEKGTGFIEKTYSKERKEQNYKINEYKAKIRNNRHSLRAFCREANAGRGINMAFSAVEGVGMGLLGMGIPDIPLFLGVLLKSIYEVALGYGYAYDTREEQIFILKLIEASLSHQGELADRNLALDVWIKKTRGGNASWEKETSFSEQLRSTSDALSGELLYLKFVQGLPVVGIAGGISDVIYQKKITDYAALKYKRRFLEKKRSESEEA